MRPGWPDEPKEVLEGLDSETSIRQRCIGSELVAVEELVKFRHI
jgi:hypothetical protein